MIPWSCLSGVVVVQRRPLARLSINLPTMFTRTLAIRFMFTVSHRHFWLSAPLERRDNSSSMHGGFRWRRPLAKATGLKDEQADPTFVFLYRGETREVAERIGIDCSKFSGPIIPVIYNLDLRDPAGYFLAANFEIRNKDVIFAANAVSVEVTKFLTFLRTIMATVNDPLVYATNYYTLINAAKGMAAAAVVHRANPHCNAPEPDRGFAVFCNHQSISRTSSTIANQSVYPYLE